MSFSFFFFPFPFLVYRIVEVEKHGAAAAAAAAAAAHLACLLAGLLTCYDAVAVHRERRYDALFPHLVGERRVVGAPDLDHLVSRASRHVLPVDLFIYFNTKR